MEWLGAWLGKRIVIADEANVLAHLVVQDSRDGVVFLRVPIVASSTMSPSLGCHGFDERARYAFAPCGWRREQVLQVAARLGPHTRVEEIVSNADQLTLCESTKAMHSVVREEAMPSSGVLGLRGRGGIELLVASSENLPGGPVFAEEGPDSYGHCARGLTFDMSGGPKGAKRPLGRPLDGEVRRHSDPFGLAHLPSLPQHSVTGF